jgi:hypothetical protein
MRAGFLVSTLGQSFCLHAACIATRIGTIKEFMRTSGATFFMSAATLPPDMSGITIHLQASAGWWP